MSSSHVISNRCNLVIVLCLLSYHKLGLQSFYFYQIDTLGEAEESILGTCGVESTVESIDMERLALQVADIEAAVGGFHVDAGGAYDVTDTGGTVVDEQHEAVVELAGIRGEVIVALGEVEGYLQVVVAQEYLAIHALGGDGVFASLGSTITYLHATLGALVDGESSCQSLYGVELRDAVALKLGGIAVTLIACLLVGIEYHAGLVGGGAVAEGEVYYLALHVKLSFHACLLHLAVHLLVSAGLGKTVVATKVDVVIVLRTLHEECLKGIEEGIVVTGAHSLVGVAVAVPAGDRTVVAHIVDVVERGEGVAHEVPAGVLLVGRSVNIELGVDIDLGQFAKRTLLYLDRQRTVERRLEDVALAGVEKFLRLFEVYPSTLAILGTDGAIVGTEHKLHILATRDVGFSHLEGEAEEIPAVGLDGDVYIESLGIEVGIGDDGCPVFAVALDVYGVGILARLFGIIRHDDATTRVDVDVWFARKSVIQGVFLVQVEIFVGFVELHQIGELAPLGIPIVIIFALLGNIQGTCLIGCFVECALPNINRLYGIGIYLFQIFTAKGTFANRF